MRLMRRTLYSLIESKSRKYGGQLTLMETAMYRSQRLIRLLEHDSPCVSCVQLFVDFSLFRAYDFLLSPSIQMVVEHAASGSSESFSLS